MDISYPLESVSTQLRPETSSLRSILLIPLDGHTAHDDFIAKLANMEYSWGLEKGELDLVTSLNTIRVHSDIVEHIERHSVALVPVESTMKTMQDITMHNSSCSSSSRQRYTTLAPEAPRVFEYVLVPLTITSPIYVRPPGSNTVKQYNYPYDNLPHFYSAGHPFHVVYNSISSILFSPTISRSHMDASLLQSISLLSDLWQNPAPHEFMNGPNWTDTHDSESESDFELESLEVSSSNSQRTSRVGQSQKHGPRRHLYLRNTALKRIDSWRKNVDVPEYYDEGVLNSNQIGRYEYEPVMRFKIIRGTMALAILGASVSAF
ncbi:hypothetical protein VKT23_000128 [Stygiomarasmius scandens]|uniref:Uncharacterized protein n=1 Tax=Marasmiellus scandens TaxID=2682957 RepID=A0ABR1K3L9_9AGAR